MKLTFNDLKTLKETLDKHKTNLIFLWNKDRNTIQLYWKKKGLSLVYESPKYKEKPKWIKATIQKVAREKTWTAHRDEKKKSLPRHTTQLSRNKHLGDTNSATPPRHNGSKGAGQRGAKERKGKRTQNTTQARQQCAKT